MKSGGAQHGVSTLLGAADPSPVLVEKRQNLRWLIVCDHASNRIPAKLGTLGLGPAELAEHIAWDIGAADAARRIAQRLDAPAILCNYSRLVIDCNRYPDAHDAAPAVSDAIPVPGNERLSERALASRRQEIFEPYQRAISDHLDAAIGEGFCPIFLSIHSCTPRMNGIDRPWHIGLAWDRDDRFTRPVLEVLRSLTDAPMGDNQPYDFELGGDFTTPEHAMTRGLAHLQVEFRNDLVRTREAAHQQADILFDAISTVSKDQGVMERCQRAQNFLNPGDPVRFSFAERREFC